MALADAGGFARTVAGLAFLGGVQAMADIVAKACSSPQTAEINATSRAATLMKWVKIGLLEGGSLVLIAAMISPEVGVAFVAGGAVEGIITWAQYAHAKRAGLESSAPGTES